MLLTAKTFICHFPILALPLENYRIVISAERSANESVGDCGTLVFLVEDDFGQSEQPTLKRLLERFIKLFPCDLLMAIMGLFDEILQIVLFDCCLLTLGINQDNFRIGNQRWLKLVDHSRDYCVSQSHAFQTCFH